MSESRTSQAVDACCRRVQREKSLACQHDAERSLMRLRANGGATLKSTCGTGGLRMSSLGRICMGYVCCARHFRHPLRARRSRQKRVSLSCDGLGWGEGTFQLRGFAGQGGLRLTQCSGETSISR